MATGENNTSWGDVTNTNLGTALEEAIVGSADVTFSSANVTLTLSNTNASQTARNLRLRCTGTTGGSTRNLVVPAIEKPYIVQNDCADSIVIKTPAGTGVTVPAGATMWVYNDGVNVISAISYAPFIGALDFASVNAVVGTLVATNLTATNATTTNLTATTVLDPATIGAASPGFRGLPQNAQTGAYTLALSDAGKQVSNTTGGWVIPANGSVAFPTGTTVVIFNNSGTSQNVSITTDTLRQAGTANTGTRALAQYGLATCVKVASTTWVISGAGVS
jgi:hypothetical protein